MFTFLEKESALWPVAVTDTKLKKDYAQNATFRSVVNAF